jgi:LPS sulfotransferase NodH
MKEYGVVIASHRSGTEVLCKGVSLAGKLNYKGEILRNSYEQPWRTKAFPGLDTTARLPMQYVPPILTEQACHEVYKMAVENEEWREKRLFFKVLAQQVPYYYGNMWNRIINDPKARMIFIKRNYLEMFVSVKNAAENGQFHFATTKEATAGINTLDGIEPWELVQSFAFMDATYEFYDIICAKRPKRSICIHYNDLLYNWTETVASVHEFLDWPELKCDPVEPPYKKQIKVPHSELLSNYGALKDWFSTTKWGHIFQ